MSPNIALHLAVLLPLLGAVPLPTSEPADDVAELQAVAKDFDHLRKPETLDKLMDLLPAKSYGTRKTSAEMLFIYARNRRQRFTWMDVFLDQPGVMKRYDELAVKLKQGYDDKKDPKAAAVNGGLLAFIRARQGRVEEANQVAAALVQNSDGLSARGRLWFAQRWSRTQVLDKLSGKLLLPIINRGNAPLLMRVTDRSGDSQTALKAIQSLEQSLDAVLASNTRDEYLSEAQDAASGTVRLCVDANQHERALRMLLRSRQSIKLNLEYVSSPILDEMEQWHPDHLMQLTTAKLEVDQVASIVCDYLLGGGEFVKEKKLSGFLPVLVSGSRVRDRIELRAFRDEARQNEFMRKLTERLERVNLSENYQPLQKYYARVAVAGLKMKTKDTTASDTIQSVAGSIDLEDLGNFAWTDASISSDADSILERILPLTWLLKVAPAETLEDPGMLKVLSACLIVSGQSCTRVHESISADVRKKADDSKAVTEILAKYANTREAAPKQHDRFTCIDDVMWARTDSLLTLADAVRNADNAEARDKSLLQNLFQYKHKSRILNKEHGDEFEAKWVKLGGTREGYSKAVLEFLINTSDPANLRIGGRDVFVNSWTGQSPWKEVEAWPEAEYSIWSDILTRRLEFVSVDELRARLSVDDVTTKEWQRLLVKLILADVAKDREAFSQLGKQLAEEANNFGREGKSPLVHQLLPFMQRPETVEVATDVLRNIPVSDQQAKNIQAWPMLALIARFRGALKSGKNDDIQAAQDRLVAVLEGSQLSVTCGFDNAGFAMARLADEALRAGRFESAGRLLGGGMKGMRQAGQWNCYRAFQDRTASLTPEQRYQFYLGFNVTSSRGLTPWFWDPTDPSRDGLCSPVPKPIPVEVYPKTVAIGWVQLLQSARDAGKLKDLSRQLLRIRRDMKDAKEETRNTLFRLTRLVRAWQDGETGDSTANLLSGLKQRDPSLDLDYLTVLALSANEVSRPLATDVLTDWCGRDDLLQHPTGIARLARLNAWSMKASDKHAGLRDTNFRAVYDDKLGQQIGAVRWSAQQAGDSLKLTRHSGPMEERLNWSESAAGDFAIQAKVPVAQLKRVWLQWGTLHFGFRNPDMEPWRQQPGYARYHYDAGGDFWSARVYEIAGKLYTAKMLAELRPTDAPAGDAMVRLSRTDDRIRFHLNDRLLLDMKIEGSPEPQTVGFYFPDLRNVELTDVRVDVAPAAEPSSTQEIRYSAVRVNHVGWRGVEP